MSKVSPREQTTPREEGAEQGNVPETKVERSQPLYALGIDFGATNSCIAVAVRTAAEIDATIKPEFGASPEELSKKFFDAKKLGEIKIDTIPNEMGNRVTPSVVTFTKEEITAGDTAYQSFVKNSANTVGYARRFIGQSFDAEEVQGDLKQKEETDMASSFATTAFAKASNCDETEFEVELCGEQKKFTASEISTFVFDKLRETAEKHSGEVIREAVITVPALFSAEQEAAVRKSAEAAGIRVMRIISEPAAAAVAFGLDVASSSQGSEDTAEGSQSADDAANGGNGDLKSRGKGEEKAHSAQGKNVPRTCCVVNVGGSTTNVTLLSINNGLMKELRTSEDVNLGGNNFTQKIMDLCMKDFARKYGRQSPLQALKANKTALMRMWQQCELVKRSLCSGSKTASVEVDALLTNPKDGEMIDFSCAVPKSRFEDVTEELKEKIMDLTDSVIQDEGFMQTEIDDVLIIGGGSKVPAVKESLEDFFLTNPDAEEEEEEDEDDSDKPIVHTSLEGNQLLADEVVATGAAVQAELLLRNRNASGGFSGRGAVTSRIQQQEMGEKGVESEVKQEAAEGAKTLAEAAEKAQAAAQGAYEATSGFRFQGRQCAEGEVATLQLSLGVEDDEGAFVPVLRKGTPLPASGRVELELEAGEAGALKVCEGEFFSECSRNHKLGELKVDAQAVDTNVFVEFAVSSSGAVRVTPLCGEDESLKVCGSTVEFTGKARWAEADVEKHLDEVEEFQAGGEDSEEEE